MSRLIRLKTYALRPASVNLIFPQNFDLRKVGTRLYSIGHGDSERTGQTRRGIRGNGLQCNQRCHQGK